MLPFLAMLTLAFASAQVPEEYHLGPGDLVEIRVFGEKGLETEFSLGAGGTIYFPVVGTIDLNGLTEMEAQEAVRKSLMDGYMIDPHVTVRVASYNSQRVEVIGGLARLGSVPLNGETTVRSLIVSAGGMANGSQGGTLTVTRTGGSHNIDLTEIEGPAGDFLLQAGDVVDVVKGSSVYLAGEVAKPGSVQFHEGLTATQALLNAGGRTKFGRLAGAYVVRGDQRIKVNLRRALKGKDADVALEPGDRIVIPVSAL